MGQFSVGANTCSALTGDFPGFHVHGENDQGGLKKTDAVIKGLLEDGFKPFDMTLVSWSGRERSRMLACDTLGGLTLRKFTGQYDKAGNPQWTDGSLLAESVYRFKGQASPVVVFCEVDFESLSDMERKKLFVGMSRAQLRLECVLSPRAERALARFL